jgi:class 3 adenylate cyclase
MSNNLHELAHWKDVISGYEQKGELFKAYDTAVEALAALPNELWLQHRAVLCLANAGATSQAEQKFIEFRLNESETTECLTLHGRILKQTARQSTPTLRIDLLNKAILRYRSAWERTLIAEPQEAYYPAINMATLYLMAGETDNAERMARSVIALVKPALARTDANNCDRYWMLVSAIEANLVLRKLDDARSLAIEATQVAGENFVNLASTARQLRSVLECHGMSLDDFGFFVAPEVLHYSGHMPSEQSKPGRLSADEVPQVVESIELALQPLRIAAAYGSLAAGSDILIAEILLRKGVKLNVILPFNVEEFVDVSVRPFGQNWVDRFDACIRKAHTVRYATSDQYLGDDNLFLYCSHLAMGLTVLCARHLAGSVRQLAIWDGMVPRGAAGTAQDIALWKHLGHTQIVIRCGSGPDQDLTAVQIHPAGNSARRSRAMLFADFKGFSKLRDGVMRTFSSHVMGKVAEVFESCSDGLDFINTWGDGIFAVYDDAGKAANAALELQDAIGRLDLKSAGLPTTLSLRLGGHLAPVFEVQDPVLKRRGFMGVHISVAARIEPITPEGCVYVTEPFAAILALQIDTQFACDYVGVTDMAKDYGAMRMFLLRRRADIEHGPAELRFLA